MSRCKQQMLLDGALAVPRTCPECGINRCVRGLDSPRAVRRPKRLYLAAPFADRPKMETIADRLRQAGFEITARWVYGGEDGLTREEIAVLDLEDVDKCDTLVSFTFPRGTLTSGGGRHVEFGYALAKGKRLVCIGERENVFHHAPGVEIYASVDAWLAHLEVDVDNS